MKPLVENNLVICAMFEERKRLAGTYGEEYVYDFSLGNPNVPAPEVAKQAIFDISNQEESAFVHGYMSNAGLGDAREAIAASLSRWFDTPLHPNNILMMVGAASGSNAILKTISDPGEQVVVSVPYFVEYGVYVRNYDGGLVVVPLDTETFQPNPEAFASMMGEKTRAVTINTPNNPTGVIYSEEILCRTADILYAKEEEYHIQIVPTSGEPYRELVYDGMVVLYVTKYYRDTAVCYSYSKSLSLPGECVGYLVIPDGMQGSEELSSAICVANRVLGCASASSLMQRVALRCVDEKTDVDAYDRNRNLLYSSLTDHGLTCIEPKGTFYLFVKTPGDEAVFCETYKKRHVLVVPGSSFACPGYARIAYCVSYQQIERSLPASQAIAKECGLSDGC